MKTVVVVATLGVLLGLTGAALADIPDPNNLDFHARWSASSTDWQILKNDYFYDLPLWSEDPTYLQVDNQRMPSPWVKYVWLEVDYDTLASFPDQAPAITCSSETVPTYMGAVSQTINWPFSWTYMWKIDPQPDWEAFLFPNAGYKGLTYPIISVEIGTWCTPEPTALTLMALGAVALLRRR